MPWYLKVVKQNVLMKRIAGQEFWKIEINIGSYEVSKVLSES